MAGDAFLGRGLIKEHRFIRYLSQLFVAPGAGHILMHACERKRGPLVVIESRRLEFGIVMAVVAGCLAVCLHKLGAVDIRMTLLAGCGRCLLSA